MKKGQRLADVCKQLDLQPYVLRYWLTEFPALRGDESEPGGRRLFSDQEVAVLARIKNLLYDEGYTIAGAKKKLDSEPVDVQRPSGQSKRRAPKAEPSADGDEATEGEDVDAEESEQLDSANAERIETLRRGVATALEEARAILDRLQARR